MGGRILAPWGHRGKNKVWLVSLSVRVLKNECDSASTFSDDAAHEVICLTPRSLKKIKTH